MKVGIEIGFNVLNKIIRKGLNDFQCDKVVATFFNTNFHYILSIFEKFPLMQKFIIYFNDEYFNLNPNDRNKLQELVDEGKLELYHVSRNKLIIHAKIYGFYKNNQCLLIAIGSSNLTRSSNQNIECASLLTEIEENHPVHEIWAELEEFCEEFTEIDRNPLLTIFQPTQQLPENFDETLLEGLWEHQKLVVLWLVRRERSIVNVPPGTGKTRIGLKYYAYLSQNYNSLTTIILVPTTTLLNQWIVILKGMDYNVIEGGSNFEGLNDYISNPEGSILVTLYNRFSSYAVDLAKSLNILKPTCLMIADECHNMYPKLDSLEAFTATLKSDYFHLGLSATIDTFLIQKKERYVNYCGGSRSVFDISLPTFYAEWNERNIQPILKNIIYKPYFYYLTEAQMKEYRHYSKLVGWQSKQETLRRGKSFSAAIQRAQYVRTLSEAINTLKSALEEYIEIINSENTLIFVFSHEYAEDIRNYLGTHEKWSPTSSVYTYDSARSKNYRKIAMEKFVKNQGFCLISEIMLAEGFDLRKISTVFLHGVHRSQRDWIQKIGRSLRYDPESPDALATIVDIVFCDSNGRVLPIERERFNILNSLSIR